MSKGLKLTSKENKAKAVKACSPVIGIYVLSCRGPDIKSLASCGTKQCCIVCMWPKAGVLHWP